MYFWNNIFLKKKEQWQGTYIRPVVSLTDEKVDSQEKALWIDASEHNIINTPIFGQYM